MTKDIIINELIKKIEEEARQKNISENKILTESGVGKDLLKNLRKGQSTSIEKVVYLADYLNISIDYLLGRTGEPINKQIINSTVKGTQIQSEIIQTQEQTKDGALKDIEDIYNNLSLDEKIKFLQAIQPFKKSAEVDKN